MTSRWLTTEDVWATIHWYDWYREKVDRAESRKYLCALSGLVDHRDADTKSWPFWVHTRCKLVRLVMLLFLLKLSYLFRVRNVSIATMNRLLEGPEFVVPVLCLLKCHWLEQAAAHEDEVDERLPPLLNIFTTALWPVTPVMAEYLAYYNCSLNSSTTPNWIVLTVVSVVVLSC